MKIALASGTFSIRGCPARSRTTLRCPIDLHLRTFLISLLLCRGCLNFSVWILSHGPISKLGVSSCYLGQQSREYWKEDQHMGIKERRDRRGYPVDKDATICRVRFDARIRTVND